jgi:type II secretory pathway pseudopilin PulG
MSAADWLVLVAIIAATLIALEWVGSRPRKVKAQAQLVASKNYQALADEYRRLSDMAITAQEHVDLRLTDLSVQVDALRDQLDQMQRILKEVE